MDDITATQLRTTESGLLDLSRTSIAKDYPHCYIKVLDNVFTAEECASLLALATSDQQWQAAMISTLTGDEIDLEYRNSGRILRFDHKTAEQIHQKLLPHVQELVEIKKGDEWEGIVGNHGRVRGTWKLLGVNERLSFLRYEPGNYFKPHYDGQLELPDGRKSRVTLQIYLNDSDDGLEGGATRILGFGRRYVDGKRDHSPRQFDVEPKTGRVLIFQQQSVYHSGQEVVRGTKYALRSDFLFEQV